MTLAETQESVDEAMPLGQSHSVDKHITQIGKMSS